MLRPGGFPEFSPDQQAVRDQIYDIVSGVFRQHHFTHIWTPAVEPVDILAKGGDIIDKQVYGLYGLAQGVEDTKDYGLHYDLTIPLARYILDHRQELVWPFRRYQIQPVWRGERHKRGRTKEFRQMDIDAIRPADMSVGLRYDAETIYVLHRAMSAVCESMSVSIQHILHISHIGLTRSIISSHGVDEQVLEQILSLLDNYYKLSTEDFQTKLQSLCPPDLYKCILDILDTKSISGLDRYAGYADLTEILASLNALGVPYIYDISIVRGNGYYKGMVCERLDHDDMSLGSLAGGGRYDHITDFIDPKQSFSGVGTSLGRFVYAVMDKISDAPTQDKYLFVNMSNNISNIIGLYDRYISQGHIAELYPTSAKFGKQLEYADRKGIKYAVIYGLAEHEQHIYKIKNLETGEQTDIQIDV